MATKLVTNSVSKFGGILFTPIWLTVVAAMHLDAWRSGFHSRARVYPLHLLNPSTNTDIYTLSNCAFFPAGSDIACFDYHLLWGSLWVEISTLSYEANSSFWLERLSVAHCTHIIQTKLMLRNRRYPKKIGVYSYRRAHRHASCSAGVICRGCGVITCNIQPV